MSQNQFPNPIGDSEVEVALAALLTELQSINSILNTIEGEVDGLESGVQYIKDTTKDSLSITGILSSNGTVPNTAGFFMPLVMLRLSAYGGTSSSATATVSINSTVLGTVTSPAGEGEKFWPESPDRWIIFNNLKTSTGITFSRTGGVGSFTYLDYIITRAA
jgi:hypothetical protein